MLWEDKVKRWMGDEVTKALISEMHSDIEYLTNTLLDPATSDILQIRHLQGIVAGIKSAIETCENVKNPYTDEGEQS